MHIKKNTRGEYVRNIDNDIYLQMLIESFVKFDASKHKSLLSEKAHFNMQMKIMIQRIYLVYEQECQEIKYAMRSS